MTEFLRWVIVNAVEALPVFGAYFVGKAVSRRELRKAIVRERAETDWWIDYAHRADEATRAALKLAEASIKLGKETEDGIAQAKVAVRADDAIAFHAMLTKKHRDS